MTKLKMIDDHFACDMDRLLGELPDAIAYLSEIREQHEQKEGLRIEQHYIGWSDETELRFGFRRMETLKEASERAAIGKKQKAADQDAKRRRDDEKAKTSPERIQWLENRKKAALLRMEMNQALSDSNL